MDILWTGTFVPTFGRNRRISQCLEAAGISCREIRVTLWPDDRIGAIQNQRIGLALRMLWVYPFLFSKLMVAKRPDVYLVSYPGWFDVPLVKLVGWLKRRPVVFDVFISLYDTAVIDRALLDRKSLAARVALWIDRISLRLSDRVIADTHAHARFLARLGGIEESRVGVVYLGADENVFGPTASVRDGTTVMFYGTYVPLQGAEWIVRAASLIPDDVDAKFVMIGGGADRERAERLAEKLALSRVVFVDPLPQYELVEQMGKAALVLGIFGLSEKASRVVPHKVYEAIACGAAVLTGGSEAVTETLMEGEVATCAMGDAAALANAIQVLLSDPVRLASLGTAGRRAFEERFSLRALSERLQSELLLAVAS